MSVYLRATFEASSIIVTSFRQGEGVILPHPHLKTNPENAHPD